MDIYGRTQVMAQHPIMDCFSLLKQWGFDGVELCLEHPDLVPAELTEETSCRVREQLAKMNMPCSVSYHKDYIYNDDLLAETKKAIELTPSFGASVFIIAGCQRRDEAGEWQRKIDRTRELVAVAENCGVTIAHEFEPGFIVGNTEQMLRVFDEIPSGHLQANLDLGHVFLCDPDPVAAITSLRGKICHGHIENMKTDVHKHLPPWEGDMDLAVFLNALKGIGFDGPLSLDLYNEPYEQVGKRSVKFIKEILQTI